jgi:hypothetical protein
MIERRTLRRSLALILGGTLTLTLSTGLAFNMGNMMNPSKWMGGDRDRDYYDAGPWGGPGYRHGGPGGYGGAPGYGYGGPGGYGGAPGYGYGGPGGYGGVPGGYGGPRGYGGPSPSAVRRQ